MRRIGLILFLAACGGSGSASSGTGNPGNSGSVTTIEWNFTTGAANNTTTVTAGTPVRWHNGDTVIHSVIPQASPPPLATGNIAPGSATPNQTISTPGTYHFICGVHGPSMSGTLVVQ